MRRSERGVLTFEISKGHLLSKKIFTFLKIHLISQRAEKKTKNEIKSNSIIPQIFRSVLDIETIS